MSDQGNRRLSIDLEEIERQLRQSAERHASLQGSGGPAPQGQPGAGTGAKSDPLAELARIVGQDDPFGALLSGEERARGREPSATPRATPQMQDPYAQDPYAQDPYAQDPYAQPEPYAQPDPYAHETYAHEDSYRQDASVGHPQEAGFSEDPRAAYAAHGFAVEHDPQDPRAAAYDPYAQDYGDDPRHSADWAGAPPHDAYDEPAPSRPGIGRKSLFTAVALVGVAVIGVGSALMFAGSVEQSGEPPLIVADPSPVRISPENPGGVEIPNQDKAIHGQEGGETRIVDREEQPVDIAELARQSPRVVLPAPGDAAAADPTGGAADDPIGRALAEDRLAEPGLEAALVASPAVAALGEPRRVRTVTVRPDGSVVAPAAAAPAVSPRQPGAGAGASAAPVAVAPAEATPAPVLPSIAALDPSAAAPRSIGDLVPLATASPAQADAGAAAAQAEPAPVPTQTASAPVPPPAPPRSAGDAPAAAVQSPAQSTGPLQLSALPQPAQPAPTPAPAAAPQGGYAVQLAIRGSEDRAREAFQQLQARYSGIIGDGQPIIRQAVVNGSTIFRVRVGPYPLDRANRACDEIKASGGDCFVAPNS